jgi:hypothetical protein
MTDAPMHGMVPVASAGVTNADNYSVRHPNGLTAEKVVGELIAKDIDLFMCSFNPAATARTEKELSQHYLDHPTNTEQRDITAIALVPEQQQLQLASGVELSGRYGQHIIFVLDESGSMQWEWAGVVVAYNQYLSRRRQNQSESDLVSVVQFDNNSRVTVNMQPIAQAPSELSPRFGGTAFAPAARDACSLARGTPSSHAHVVVFMSDGGTGDSAAAAGMFSTLNREIRATSGIDLELHVIAFGTGASTAQLAPLGTGRSTPAQTPLSCRIFLWT